MRAQDVYSLLRAHLRRDDAAFWSIAECIGLNEGAAGRSKVQAHIQDFVVKGRKGAGRPVSVLPQSLSSTVEERTPSYAFSDLGLAEGTDRSWREILDEYRGIGMLRLRGLEPGRRILLEGPPGTGKTRSAEALALELGMPFYCVLQSGLVGSYLGETGERIAKVFDGMRRHPGVWFLDEVDAIASSREASHSDVGEIRRSVNVLLTALDVEGHDSIVVASTNFPGILDRAFVDRFDHVVRYEMPTREIVRRMAEDALAGFDTGDVDWASVAAAGEGLSHRQVAKGLRKAAVRAAVAGLDRIETDTVVSALSARGTKVSVQGSRTEPPFASNPGELHAFTRGDQRTGEDQCRPSAS